MTPKVSVVTSVYNGDPYFDRAIPGILSQTYEDFEFILVDDGSSDHTLERLHEVAKTDPRIRVFAPGRLGAAGACNYGVERARGEYIARQDFDDKSYPDRLRLQVAYLDGHPEVGVLGGYYLHVDENRNERYVRMVPTGHREIIAAMAKYIPIAHTLATFRRQAWSEAGRYPAVGNLIDLRLWLQIAKRGWQFANLPETLGEHYVHSASWFHRSYSYSQRQQDLARVQAEVVRELGLPSWMYVFALGRRAYAYMPTSLKRFVRREMAGTKEKDA